MNLETAHSKIIQTTYPICVAEIVSHEVERRLEPNSSIMVTDSDTKYLDVFGDVLTFSMPKLTNYCNEEWSPVDSTN